MNNSGLITLPKDSQFETLFNELVYALRSLSSDDLSKIFLQASGMAISSTWKSKKKAVDQTVKFSKDLFRRYKDDGIKNSLQNDMNRVKDFTLKLPEKSKDLYNKFISLPPDQKVETVAILILTLSIFFISAGGLDFEGGIPDTDIILGGIGNHRNIFSHSVVVGLSIEFVCRFAILILENIKNRLPIPHHPVWDRVYNFVDSNKNLAFSAMWLGIGTHLIKDTGLFAHLTKPYSGLPVDMSIGGHKALFMTNGLASDVFAVAYKSI